MPTITLPDYRLRDYNLDNLGLSELRNALRDAKQDVCIERAQYVTEFLKGAAQQPIELVYAGAVRHFLSHKAAQFFDDNLIPGTTTSKPVGAPVYPELTGLPIWPELDTISTRKSNPLRLDPKDAVKLNQEIFPYWMERNILEVTRKRMTSADKKKSMDLFQRIVFFIASKAGALSHTVPHYRTAMEKGLSHLILLAADREQAARNTGGPDAEAKATFYKAVQIALGGIIDYATNLSRKARALAQGESDPVRRANLTAMADICARVPAQPARTFREAVTALWLLQIGIHAENINMAMSPGRLDQILYPWYRADIDANRLTIPEALELLGCLWLKINDNRNLTPESAEQLFGGAGTVPAVTVGGVDAKGEDAVNDLTYLMLRVTELLKTRDPSLNARYHYEKNTQQYRDRVAEVIIETKAVPAFHNDVAAIKTLRNQRVEVEHARDYAIIGCVELSASGRSYDASSSIILNLVSALELALYRGKRPITGDDQIGPETPDPAKMASFEEFWTAVKTQLGFVIDKAILLNEEMGHVHQEHLPTPLLSALFEGPLEKGKDLIRGGALYNASGATHVGFGDTVDSLSAIEDAVFDKKRCTFAELLAALRNNFSGQEPLRLYLANKTPKYGTNAPVARKNAQALIDFLFDTYQSHTNYRGGKYRPAYWTMTNHAGQGKLTGALPNGRPAHEPFASGITPVSRATADLTIALREVAKLDALHIPGGQALNIKYPHATRDDAKRFGDVVEAYFRSGEPTDGSERAGSLHVQFNVMSNQMLQEARKDPTKYPELLVRVSGYSAYFNDLNDAMKDEIIRRTGYDLTTGASTIE